MIRIRFQILSFPHSMQQKEWMIQTGREALRFTEATIAHFLSINLVWCLVNYNVVVILSDQTTFDVCSVNTHHLAPAAAAPAPTTQASSQSLHSHTILPPPMHTMPYMWRRREEWKEGEVEKLRGGAQRGAFGGEAVESRP